MTQPDIEIVIKEDFTYRECSDVANDVFKKTQWLLYVFLFIIFANCVVDVKYYFEGFSHSLLFVYFFLTLIILLVSFMGFHYLNSIPKPEAEPDYRKKQESKNQDFLKSQSNEPLEYASSSAVELEKEKNTREGLTILESS
ncbi:dubious [Schizosaccharomyces pombe]|uniref:Putative uncharacterized membrane protein C622.04 n=1 Tax=Schizosaccharomyces pombe (strain 972 / ATCC 24843) TaxID=284812 RepID=YC84_SCHPO|nr:uncharacterized protein SPCC622.04 [Schizosaccharomyces pombe]O94594.1 RecName: Full=Putative uncharacterized membrane protein C622.04 [Schizosaccharomyces pombe 972h-]CAA21860.1 dubious [Schizosaccharomyces pombe]|eukprot:NP_588176.1 uncharacterized protein SPCC622.04 [Schizosaccharomyces pombe]